MKKFLLILLITILGCGVDIAYIKSPYKGSNIESFNYLHNKLKNHYVFLEYKGIDSNALYDKYRDKITDDLTQEELLFYLRNYINEYKDGHTDIDTTFGGTSYYSNIIGEYSDDFNRNFNWSLIKKNYLYHPDKIDYQLLGVNLRDGIIEKDGKTYGYIYYPSFMNTLDGNELERVLERFERQKVEGIILDIRNNGGGAVMFVFTMLRYFGKAETDESVKVARVWRRDSLTDYKELSQIDVGFMMFEELNIEPYSNGYKGRVALLTNRGSYSAASIAPTAFKAFDNVKQIGTKTGGGMGTPVGGYLPNGWSYRFSGNIVMPYDAAGIDDVNKNYEDGVPADIEVEDDLATTDKDEIIERAITWINTGN